MNEPVPLPPALAVEEEPFTVEELDTALDDVPADSPGAVTARRWLIESTGEAEWAMRRYAETIANARQVVEQATEWKARIEAWTDRVLAPLDRRAQFFGDHLRHYAARERERTNGRTKAVILPSGIVQTRLAKPKAKVYVANPDAWEKWARANVDSPLVRAKYEVVAAATTSALAIVEEEDGSLVVSDAETGEVLDWAGVKVDEGSLSFSIEPA